MTGIILLVGAKLFTLQTWWGKSMHVISVSDSLIDQIQQIAVSRGMDLNACAEELLTTSLSNKGHQDQERHTKPNRAMQFAGIVPSGRTSEQIDAAINEYRESWDSRVTHNFRDSS